MSAELTIFGHVTHNWAQDISSAIIPPRPDNRRQIGRGASFDKYFDSIIKLAQGGRAGASKLTASLNAGSSERGQWANAADT